MNGPLNLFHSKLWVIISVILIVIGCIGAVVGFALAPVASWAVLDAAFLTVLGITNGMFAWVAVFRVAQARWTPVISRIGQSGLAFVPALTVLLIILLAGAPIYMKWVMHPIPEKHGYLNMPFFVVREILCLGLLWGLIFLITKWGLDADLRDNSLRSNHDFHYKLNAASAVAVVWYSIASSIVAFDFIMSLTPEWVSTVFGAYMFCTDAYAALAVMVLLSWAGLQMPLARNYLRPQQFKDMGNLMLAFALFDMGLFFAQYLTIWYENLPWETGFILVRYMYGPWPIIAWPSLIIAYSAPFVLLQSRYIKTHPQLLSIVCIIALLGFGMERYVLVLPSLFPTNTAPSPAALLVLPGLVGVFILCVRWFTHRYPAISSAQDALNVMNNPEAEIRL